LIWFTLAAVLAVTVLSIVGTFLGAERAGSLFTSLPCAVGWGLVGALFVVCLAVSFRPWRRPGLFALHLAPILVLLGGFWGSAAIQGLASRFGAEAKLPGGLMLLPRGEPTDLVIEDTGRIVGHLPFGVRLEDFRILYYENQPWYLLAVLPAGEPGEGPRLIRLDWSLGTELTIPSTDWRICVLAYESRARLAYPDGEMPRLEVDGPSGAVREVPARPGERFTLESQDVTLSVARVFDDLSIQMQPWGPEAYDRPGSPENPALLLRAVSAERGESAVYVGVGGIVYSDIRGLPPMRYVVPEPIGLARDPRSSVPGMEIEAAAAGRTIHRFLVPDPRQGLARMPLEKGEGADGPALFLTRLPQVVRQYESEVTVLEDGQAVGRGDIRVNAPFHYGGYGFYQHSYDEAGGQFTVLRIKSDSGLPAIWAGYVLLAAGTFWVCWGAPIAGWLRRRDVDGR
jgi:hypothetical protein